MSVTDSTSSWDDPNPRMRANASFAVRKRPSGDVWKAPKTAFSKMLRYCSSAEDEAGETSAWEGRFILGPKDDLDGDVTEVRGHRSRKHTALDPKPPGKKLNLAERLYATVTEPSCIAPTQKSLHRNKLSVPVPA